MGKPTISFEFFPPKTLQGEEAFLETAKKLSALNPKFMTVTFGAGGSTRDGTIKTLEALQSVTNVPLGCHLTFISLNKPDLKDYLDRLWVMGIQHIIALRGDVPKDLQWPLDADADYYQYTSDFVEGIKAHRPFEISVGAYPEKHPDAQSMAADILALKKKCDAGSDRAITQFFFNHAHYEEFLEEVAKAGIKTAIVPGLLPVGNYENMLKFADRCGANVPASMRNRFESAEESDHPAIAANLLLWQIDDLARIGARHLHFYTLNKADMLVETCMRAGLGV
jgi:methylenetetrahydrofolate reductase (NADPH)